MFKLKLWIKHLYHKLHTKSIFRQLCRVKNSSQILHKCYFSRTCVNMYVSFFTKTLFTNLTCKWCFSSLRINMLAVTLRNPKQLAARRKMFSINLNGYSPECTNLCHFWWMQLFDRFFFFFTNLAYM